MEIIEFKNYDLKIKLTPFINIIGKPSSGKTNLLKMLINKVPNNDLYIDNTPISNYSLDFKKRNLAVCLNDLTFNLDYVNEELLYYQNILGFDQSTAYEQIKKFNEYFELNEMLDTKIEYLTTEEKALIKILSLLIIKPAVLGLDSLLSYLNLETKLKVCKYAKKNDIAIINVTSTKEELLLGTDIIILDNYKLLEYNKTKNILENDKLLIEIGFELPFAFSLSNGLNYYDLLNKKYYDNKTLVRAIWK